MVRLGWGRATPRDTGFVLAGVWLWLCWIGSLGRGMRSILSTLLVTESYWWDKCCVSGCIRDVVDYDGEALSVRVGSERSSVENELRVARRQARIIAAAEKALSRIRRRSLHRGSIRFFANRGSVTSEEDGKIDRYGTTLHCRICQTNVSWCRTPIVVSAHQLHCRVSYHGPGLARVTCRLMSPVRGSEISNQ